MQGMIWTVICFISAMSCYLVTGRAESWCSFYFGTPGFPRFFFVLVDWLDPEHTAVSWLSYH